MAVSDIGFRLDTSFVLTVRTPLAIWTYMWQ